MPIIQIDWQEIKEKFGDVTAIYAFTHRQASLLLSLSEQLSWEKTFRDFGYDFDDKDDLDWEIEDLRNNLVSPVDLADIIPYIDEIEDLLRSLQQLGVCCDDVKPISDKYDRQNPDFPGTPPDTWGDESVADSDDWVDLVCGAANAYVDLLKDTNNELDRIITAAALGIGAIAGLLTLLSGAGLILAIGYGTAATIVGGLVAGASIGTFTGVDEDLEGARDDIVCAVLNGTPEDLADAIEGAVSSLAWTLWFQFIDYENAHAVMIDGTNGSDNLPANRGYSNCDCVVSYDIDWNTDFQTDEGSPHYRTGAFVDTAWTPSAGGTRCLGSGPGQNNAAMTRVSINDYFGISLGTSDVLTIHRINYDYYRAGTATTHQWLLEHDGGTFTLQDFGTGPTAAWYPKEHVFDPPLEVTLNQTYVIHDNSGALGGNGFIDNFHIEANINE